MNLPKAGNRSFQTRLIALFIAVALSVTWYYQVKRWAVGVSGNSTNMVTFYAMSKTRYHMETLGVWRARIGGLWIAGQMFDSVATNGLINLQDYQAQKIALLEQPRQDQETQQAWGRHVYIEDYEHVFGLYHACWLFLFFVTLILFIENPLIIMFGTLAGMMYTLTPAAVYYAYPWDIPSMLFFTLGYLVWREKRYNWMLAVIFVGCAFKETTAVIALLYFFTPLSWKKRAIYFASAAILTYFQKVAIMEIMYNIWKVHTQDFTLWPNVKEFFSVKWNHFIFVNAGTLIISILLPARTMVQWGTKALIFVFWGCQAFAGSFNEFRIMLEVLPISLIAIADFLYPLAKMEAAPVNQLKPNSKGAGKQRG